MGRPREIELDVALERAMQLFWDRGYEHTSTRDLVDVTGLGQGSLYHAFGSKHGVFEAALDRYLALQAGALVAALDDAPDVSAAIRGVLEALVALDLDPRCRRGCLMVNAATELAGHDDVVRRKVTAAYRRIEDALEAAVMRGRRAGQLAEGPSARAVAHFLVTTLNGLRVVGKATGDRRRLQDSVDVAMRALG